MHIQIIIISFLYAVLILYRKKVLLQYFNVQTWLMIKSGLMFIMLAIISLFNKKRFYDKNVLEMINTNMITIIIFIGFTLIEGLGWLYILKNSDMSKMIPLNSVYIALFSAILGVVVLNEQFTINHMVGVIFAAISIYLLQ